MTRQQEYDALLEELQTVPPTLAGTAKRAKARAARRRFGVSLGSLAAVAAAFVIVVNAMPTFALACGSIPILRELAAAVAFSPSLSEAVRHDYVQYVGKSQTVNGVTVTLETVIADQQQLVGFYRTDLPAETSATCNLLGEASRPTSPPAATAAKPCAPSPSTSRTAHFPRRSPSPSCGQRRKTSGSRWRGPLTFPSSSTRRRPPPL